MKEKDKVNNLEKHLLLLTQKVNNLETALLMSVMGLVALLITLGLILSAHLDKC
jgi:hypothetical protein